MARLKDIALGVKDLFMLDPMIIREEAGWNVRLPSPELDAHIRQLADSIKEIGVQEPVTVYLKNDIPFLTNGHCRLMAVKLAISEGAEIKAVPARAEERYANDADRVLGMITRNSGKPLTSIEQAEVVKRLMAFGWAIGDIVKKTGFSRTHINNLLSLSSAPAAVTEMVKDGKVSARTAVKALRSGAERAEKILTDAVKIAAAAGKGKATEKHFEKPVVVPGAPLVCADLICLAEGKEVLERLAGLEKSVIYYRSCLIGERPQFVPAVIRLHKAVRGDGPFSSGHASPGDLPCVANRYGAVSVTDDNGRFLGVKPAEFEVLEWAETTVL